MSSHTVTWVCTICRASGSLSPISLAMANIPEKRVDIHVQGLGLQKAQGKCTTDAHTLARPGACLCTPVMLTVLFTYLMPLLTPATVSPWKV